MINEQMAKLGNSTRNKKSKQNFGMKIIVTNENIKCFRKPNTSLKHKTIHVLEFSN